MVKLCRVDLRRKFGEVFSFVQFRVNVLQNLKRVKVGFHFCAWNGFDGMERLLRSHLNGVGVALMRTCGKWRKWWDF